MPPSASRPRKLSGESVEVSTSAPRPRVPPEAGLDYFCSPCFFGTAGGVLGGVAGAAFTG